MIIQPPKKTVLQDYSKTLFLAGGISNCPNWQDQACDSLKNCGLTLINPRNPDYNNSDDSAEKQIRWEHYYLQRCPNILFWFPKETLCPITLFEYGKCLINKNLYVGCHPEYARKFDLKIQTMLERPEIILHTNLDHLLDEVLENYSIPTKIGW